MKDFVAAAIALGIIGVPLGLLLLSRRAVVRKHQEQFKATGAASFPLPSVRAMQREEHTSGPVASLPTQEVPLVLVDTDTGEQIRLDADGLPMTEADIAARTAPTVFTVDTQRLTEILKQEPTGEWPLNPETWAEIGAAEQFMRDPLTSPVMPPQHLMEEAGNPALAAAFWTLVDGLTTDWSDADSECHFWDRETPLETTQQLSLTAA